MKNISGSAFLFSRDDIDTDLIIPAKYLTTADPRELAWHVLEPLRGDDQLLVAGGQLELPEKSTEKISEETALIDEEKFRAPIVVAGKNFGCGSSREHAVWALAGAGAVAVIAESFARIFFRNSINFGLPTVTLPQATKKISAGDKIEIDFEKNEIHNLSKDEKYEFNPLPEFLREIVEAGGLLNQI